METPVVDDWKDCRCAPIRMRDWTNDEVPKLCPLKK